jgi:tetratricopeptide (TPR) repeat protein
MVRVLLFNLPSLLRIILSLNGERSMSKLQHMTFGRITNWLTVGLAFLAPLWFLPLSPNPIGFQKQYLLFVFGMVLFVLWAVQSLRWKRVLFSFSAITLAATSILIVTATSAALSVNPTQQFLGRMLVVTGFSLAVLFGTTLQTSIPWKRLLRVLLYSGAILSLLTWLQLAPWNLATSINNFIGTNFASDISFTLAESPLALLAFLLPVSVAGLMQLREEKSEKTAKNRVLAVLGSSSTWAGLNLATIGLVIASMVRNSALRPIILPFNFGWGIAVENFKNVRTLLIGIGPESFLMAFHRFRDVTFNSTDIWSTRFSTNSTELLHVLTTTGALGLIAWIAFWVTVLISCRLIWKKHPSLAVFLILQAVMFAIIPMNVLSFITLTLSVLALTTEIREKHNHLIRDVVILLSAIRIIPHGEVKTIKSQGVFALALTGLFLLVGALYLFVAGKAYASQAAYTLSLHAALRNEVTRAYQLQQAAIEFNPTNTAHHRAYAATNLAIARSLAQKEDLSEEERQLFARLLQQAIRESRTAAQLVPQETENWETLSSIYANLLNVEGAEEWATAGLIQAIQTDPISPQLRSGLGSLYLTLGDYTQALRMYEQAIQLKPDWAIGYAGYGQALAGNKQWSLATQAFERAVQLTEEGSEERVAIEGLLSQARDEAAKVEAQEKKEEEKKQPAGAVPNPTQPSLPTQPVNDNAPSDFGQLIDPAQQTDAQPQATPTPQGDSSVVLPDDVGF